MTKVKETKARKNGKMSVVSSAMNSSLDRKMVTAERNGEKRNFPVNIWNHLPEDKEGWKESDQKPADPALKADKKGEKETESSADDTIKTAEPTPEQLRKDAGASYKEVFGKYPSKELTTEEVLNLISEKEATDAEEADMVDLTVDQEFLDTNPDRAKEGLKVGEVIKVKKGGE